MKVNFSCGYYSDLAHKKTRRPEDYWDAYFYVWAVKVGRFKRSFFIHEDGKKVAITDKNFDLVRRTFGSYIAGRVTAEWSDKAILIPVPSKDGVVGARDFRTSQMLVESVKGTAVQDRTSNGLLWSEQLEKAHQGGTRRRDFLKSHLSLASDVSGREIVLIDDLLSTGGSLLACKDFLEDHGAKVLGAVTCGRTIYDFQTKPFGLQEISFDQELADFGK